MAGAEPLIAMKIPGRTDCQTTANIYTRLKSETLKKSGVELQQGFRKKREVKGAHAKAKNTRDKRSRKPEMDMSLP